MPPPLPDQTVSEDHAPPGLTIFNAVPPTTVAHGSLEGGVMFPVQAPKSPDAWKKLCPWAAYCMRICSRAGSICGPNPHEQLNCFARLSVAIRLSTPFGAVDRPI